MLPLESRFLIVDDSQLMRKVLSEALKQLGYTDIIEAADGTHALRELKSAAFMSKPFDYVLADLWMIDMGGHQLLKLCQADPELKPSKFIFVTAEREKKHLDVIMKDGAEDYIFKPIDANLLRVKFTELAAKLKAKAAQHTTVSHIESLEPVAPIMGAAELKALFNAVPGFVVRVTSDFEIQEINNYLRAGFNISAKELISLDLIRSLFSNYPSRSTFELKTDVYGDIHHFLVVAQKYNNNTECILVGISNTAQKRAEEKLRLMSTRIATAEEMASEIAHHASIPLLVIQTRAMRLRKLAETDSVVVSDLIDSVQKIETSTQQLKKTVKSLRNFSKTTEREAIKNVPLQSLADEVLELWRGRFMERQIDLQVGEFPCDVTLDCRESEISQVLLHLLNSAFDSVDRSGLLEKWVKVEALKSGTNVEIHISHSSGASIDPSTAGTDVDGGIASGLSISKRVVEDHRGRLTMSSNEESGQTKFVVSLPVSAT